MCATGRWRRSSRPISSTPSLTTKRANSLAICGCGNGWTMRAAARWWPRRARRWRQRTPHPRRWAATRPSCPLPSARKAHPQSLSHQRGRVCKAWRSQRPPTRSATASGSSCCGRTSSTSAACASGATSIRNCSPW
ncbi:hypothetical protein SDC9_91616 [bioreactor metagenome]|uniref:Uncharacterized protein n=1 Tax=bioreactor metagenome TaxID=1076179 RepID=A0A645A589_9ZZZZ